MLKKAPGHKADFHFYEEDKKLFFSRRHSRLSILRNNFPRAYMCFPHSLVYFERQMQLTLLPFSPSLVMQFLGGAINNGGGGGCGGGGPRRLRRLRRPRRF